MASARAKRIQAGGARQRARDPRGGDADGARGWSARRCAYFAAGFDHKSHKVAHSVTAQHR